MNIGTYVKVTLASGYRVKGHVVEKSLAHYTVKISEAVAPIEEIEKGDEIIVSQDMVSPVPLRRLRLARERSI